MDTGSFSTAEIGAYAVDGGFLADLLGRMQDVARRHGAQNVSTRVEVALSSGPHGRVMRRYEDATPFLDGSGASRPDKVSIMVYGTCAVRGEHQTFVMSVDLVPENGGFIMSQGPAELAHEGFETLRGAMAAAERMSTLPDKALDLPPSMTVAVWKSEADLRRAERIDLLRIWLPAIAALSAFAWGLTGDRSNTVPGMLLSLGLTLITLSQWTLMEENRRIRRRRFADEARSRGLPPPRSTTGTRRTIDLSVAAGDTDAARLTHEPTIPLVL
jgi:hypothetical protein